MKPDSKQSYLRLAREIGCWFLNAEPSAEDVATVARRLQDWVECPSEGVIAMKTLSEKAGE